MPQDKLQSVKDKYSGPTIGPMSLLQQFQYEGNRPEWLNRAIEIASHVGSLMGMDEPSGGLGNINLAGDLIPFGNKSASAFDKLDNIMPKLHELISKTRWSELGSIATDHAKMLMRSDPNWAANFAIKDPELIHYGNEYVKLNDLANKEIDNALHLKKLGLPNLLDPKPVTAVESTIKMPEMTEFGKLSTKFREELVKHYGLDEVLGFGGKIRDVAKRIANVEPANAYMYSPELKDSAQKYVKWLDNRETLKNLKLPSPNIDFFKKPFAPIPSEVPPDTSKVVPFNTKETQSAIKGLKNSIVDYIGYGDTPHITYDELKNHFIGYNDWVTEDHIKDAITKGIKEGRLAKTPEGLRLTSGLPTPPSSNIK